MTNTAQKAVSLTFFWVDSEHIDDSDRLFTHNTFGSIKFLQQSSRNDGILLLIIRLIGHFGPQMQR